MGQKILKSMLPTRALLSEVLAHADTKTLAKVIAAEHPQTAAIVLAHLDAKRGAELLKRVPENRRSDLLERVARLASVSPEILDEVAESMRTLLLETERQGLVVHGGVDHVAAMLKTMDSETSTTLLKNIADRDTRLAERIKAGIFQFRDLAKLKDEGVRQILKEIDNATLMLALKGASEEIALVIYRNVSERAAQRLQEDLAAMPKVKRTDVEAAQRLMADKALALLSEEGQIG